MSPEAWDNDATAHDPEHDKQLYAEFHSWQTRLYVDMQTVAIDPDILRLLLTDLQQTADLIAAELTIQKQSWNS